MSNSTDQITPILTKEEIFENQAKQYLAGIMLTLQGFADHGSDPSEFQWEGMDREDFEKAANLLDFIEKHFSDFDPLSTEFANRIDATIYKLFPSEYPQNDPDFKLDIDEEWSNGLLSEYESYPETFDYTREELANVVLEYYNDWLVWENDSVCLSSFQEVREDIEEYLEGGTLSEYFLSISDGMRLECFVKDYGIHQVFLVTFGGPNARLILKYYEGSNDIQDVYFSYAWGYQSYDCRLPQHDKETVLTIVAHFDCEGNNCYPTQDEIDNWEEILIPEIPCSCCDYDTDRNELDEEGRCEECHHEATHEECDLCGEEFHEDELYMGTCDDCLNAIEEEEEEF